MKWPWRRKVKRLDRIDAMNPFRNSPFNKSTIEPGDPGWDIFQKAIDTRKPVSGTYNADTGEIISMEVHDD